MLYEAKKGTKAYDYIKGILEAEEKEYQAYMKRVDEAVGFEFDKWQGYQPNRFPLREYLITAIWLPIEQYEKLDKKLWRKVGSKMFDDGRYVSIAPNKRCKQGKAIAAVLASYKIITSDFRLMNDLLGDSILNCYTITQLLRHNDRIFAFFDDSIRAEKQNPDFTEITIGEYEDIVNSDKED